MIVETLGRMCSIVPVVAFQLESWPELRRSRLAEDVTKDLLPLLLVGRPNTSESALNGASSTSTTTTTAPGRLGYGALSKARAASLNRFSSHRAQRLITLKTEGEGHAVARHFTASHRVSRNRERGGSLGSPRTTKSAHQPQARGRSRHLSSSGSPNAR